MHAATGIHSRSKATNETLQEYIQWFMNLVILATGTDPNAVTCHVTIVLFIRHLLNKEIKKQVWEQKQVKPCDVQWLFPRKLKA